MCIHILNFNSFKSSQLCKLYLIYIVTWVCCNHCNICVMTYLKAMGQGHILTYTLKVHNLGGTKLSKFSKFNTADTKNWRPWNFRGFLINWIYLSETLLGPTGHFFNGQKRQKRAERFWFGVFFTCFCLSVFCYFISWQYLSIFSHEILKSCSWYNIGGQYIQTMPPVCWGPFWGILGAYFGIYAYFSWYLFNILSWNFVQLFLA